VGLEGLLTELGVAAVLDSVELKTVRVGVDEVILGEEVRDTIHSGTHGEHHHDDDLVIGHLVLTKISDILSNIVGHLRSGGRYAIVVLDHTIVELRRHSDNHVIVVGVEIATFRDIVTEGSIVMVASQQVVRIVVETRLMGGGL